jgi:hypothetical protein
MLVTATGLTSTARLTHSQATSKPSGATTVNAANVGVLNSSDTRIDPALHGDMTTLNAKVPALGQALAAASVPVVMTAAQVTTLTPPTAAAVGSSVDGGTNSAAVKTNTDTLVTAGGGGYVRQDSTATIAKESGGNLAALLAAVGDTTGLTFARVKIDQSAAAGIAILGAATASTVWRLHALIVSADVAGTLLVRYDNDGAGTTPVAMSGTMSVAATGKINIPFTPNKAGCLATASGKALTIYTSQKFNGYAIVSSASA